MRKGEVYRWAQKNDLDWSSEFCDGLQRALAHTGELRSVQLTILRSAFQVFGGDTFRDAQKKMLQLRKLREEPE